VNEFWNGTERSNSLKRNAWHMQDYYQQRVCFTKPTSRQDNESEISDVNVVEITCLNEFNEEKKVRDIGLEKFDKKRKLNRLYFDSGLKDVIFQRRDASGDRSESREKVMQNRKKTGHEL